MREIIDNIKKSSGPVLVYSNWKKTEGIGILKKVLKYQRPPINSVEWVGGLSNNVRNKILNRFNHPNNVYGEKIKVFLVTAAGAEGISLRNIRQVHIMEPHWNMTRIEQVIGRAIRICSHTDLPKNEWIVDVYSYILS